MTKFAVAAALATPRIQGETTSHAPSARLIHSSHTWNQDRVSASAETTRNPTMTALRVAVVSYSNSSTQGDSISQMPSAQSHQSSHCLGGVNVTAAMQAPIGWAQRPDLRPSGADGPDTELAAAAAARVCDRQPDPDCNRMASPIA